MEGQCRQHRQGSTCAVTLPHGAMATEQRSFLSHVLANMAGF